VHNARLASRGSVSVRFGFREGPDFVDPWLCRAAPFLRARDEFVPLPTRAHPNAIDLRFIALGCGVDSGATFRAKPLASPRPAAADLHVKFQLAREQSEAAFARVCDGAEG